MPDPKELGHSENHAAYHSRPVPHYVLSQSMWDHFQANQPEVTKVGSLLMGEIGSFLDLPVYLNECPWEENHRAGF